MPMGLVFVFSPPLALGLSKELHLIRLFKQLVIELAQVVRHCAQLSFIVTGGSSQLVLQQMYTN